MKTISKILVTVILFAAFNACTNESDITDINKDSKIKVSKDNFWNLQSSDIVIAKSVGKYIDIYTPSDFYAVVSAQKPDPLSDVFFSSYSSIYKTCNNCDEAKTLNSSFCVSIGEMKLKTESDVTNAEEENLSSLYGKNVKFSINNVNRTQSALSSDSDTTVSMYVPELIEILSPSVLTEEDMYPLCYYENFHRLCPVREHL